MERRRRCVPRHNSLRVVSTRNKLTRGWTISALSRTGVLLITVYPAADLPVAPSVHHVEVQLTFSLDVAIANPLSDASSHMGLSIIPASVAHDLTLACELWRTAMDQACCRILDTAMLGRSLPHRDAWRRWTSRFWEWAVCGSSQEIAAKIGGCKGACVCVRA